MKFNRKHWLLAFVCAVMCLSTPQIETNAGCNSAGGTEVTVTAPTISPAGPEYIALANTIDLSASSDMSETVSFDWGSSSGDSYTYSGDSVGEQTVTCTLTVDGATGDCSSSSDVTVNVVEGAEITCDDVGDGGVVAVGTEITVTAVNNPNGTWPSDYPKWDGDGLDAPSAGEDSGTITSTTGGYYKISAICGNTEYYSVTFQEVTSISPSGTKTIAIDSAAPVLTASITEDGNQDESLVQWYKDGAATGDTGLTFTPPSDVAGDFTYIAKCGTEAGYGITITVVEVISISKTGSVFYAIGDTATSLTATETSGTSDGKALIKWFDQSGQVVDSGETFTPPTNTAGKFTYTAKCGTEEGASIDVYVIQLDYILSDSFINDRYVIDTATTILYTTPKLSELPLLPSGVIKLYSQFKPTKSLPWNSAWVSQDISNLDISTSEFENTLILSGVFRFKVECGDTTKTTGAVVFDELKKIIGVDSKDSSRTSETTLQLVVDRGSIDENGGSVDSGASDLKRSVELSPEFDDYILNIEDSDVEWYTDSVTTGKAITETYESTGGETESFSTKCVFAGHTKKINIELVEKQHKKWSASGFVSKYPKIKSFVEDFNKKLGNVTGGTKAVSFKGLNCSFENYYVDVKGSPDVKESAELSLTGSAEFTLMAGGGVGEKLVELSEKLTFDARGFSGKGTLFAGGYVKMTVGGTCGWDATAGRSFGKPATQVQSGFKVSAEGIVEETPITFISGGSLSASADLSVSESISYTLTANALDVAFKFPVGVSFDVAAKVKIRDNEVNFPFTWKPDMLNHEFGPYTENCSY